MSCARDLTQIYNGLVCRLGEQEATTNFEQTKKCASLIHPFTEHLIQTEIMQSILYCMQPVQHPLNQRHNNLIHG